VELEPLQHKLEDAGYVGTLEVIVRATDALGNSYDQKTTIDTRFGRE